MDKEEETIENNYVQEIIDLIHAHLKDENLAELLSDYHENDIAQAFEQLSPKERKAIYPILGAEMVSDIFSYSENASEYLKELNLEKAAKIIEHMDSNDTVDVLEDMDLTTKKKIAGLIDKEAAEDIKLILSYDEDEVGSKMTNNYIVIKNDISIREAKKELIAQANENDNISTIYVCNKNDEFYGAIELKDLLIAKSSDKLESLIITSYPYFSAHEKISDCIERIKDYAEDSLPVIDDNNKLLGIITSQDIVEVVDDEMGDDYAKFAGLTAEEDLNEKTTDSIKKRLPWLIVLLFLGMIVSGVIGTFEGIIAKLSIIICFQSLILDMAGNVGTQSLAVTIRVLTDENLVSRQKFHLILKEMKVGLCNGLLLGIMTLVFISAYIFMIKDYTITYAILVAGCVGISLVVAMIISSLVGTVIPLFFHKINVDPAVASGPLITTVNDLVAVITYYGLSWFLLINILHINNL